MGIKDTLSNLAEKVRNVFTRDGLTSLETSTVGSEGTGFEETSDLPKGAAYQVNLFEGSDKPDANGVYYHRVFAKKVSEEPHLLVIERNGEQYNLPSGYDLTKLDVNGILLGFSYAPQGKTSRIYKLPQDLRTPPSEAAVEVYPPQSQLEKDQIVNGATGVKRFLIELNRLRDAFKSGWDRLQNYAAEYGKFAQNVLGKARSVATNFTATSSSPPPNSMAGNNGGRPRVPVAPRRSKQEEKEWQRNEKDRDKYIRKLFGNNKNA